MKKMRFLGVVLITTALLTSCGNKAIETDAKKVAEIQCKAQKLAQKALSGDATVAEESQKLAEELAVLSKEIEAKYTSDSDKKKFAESLSAEMGNCN
jgi:hypothetical protein